MLLGLTAVFLCFLLTLSHRDRAALQAQPVTVETEHTVPRETLTPDFSPLDLNTATAEELTALPGIGEELAGRIVAWRAEHGPFACVEEIMEVKGIGQGKFEELVGRITVEGKDGT